MEIIEEKDFVLIEMIFFMNIDCVLIRLEMRSSSAKSEPLLLRGKQVGLRASSWGRCSPKLNIGIF